LGDSYWYKAMITNPELSYRVPVYLSTLTKHRFTIILDPIYSAAAVSIQMYKVKSSIQFSEKLYGF